MNPSLTVRSEFPADIDAIHDVTVAALRAAKALGAAGCCLVGHPEYYRKFGFDNLPGLVFEGVPPEFFFALRFDGRVPQGKVTFHEAFAATA